jgi:hypothetical protein
MTYSVLLSTLDDSALRRASQGTIEKRLKRGLSSTVGIRRPKKSVCCVMAQIDPAKLPNKLIDIEVLTQMALIDGLSDELLQKVAPLALHGENLIPDRTLHIIERPVVLKQIQNLSCSRWVR